MPKDAKDIWPYYSFGEQILSFQTEMKVSSSEDEGMAILEAFLPSERVTIHVFSNLSSHDFYFYLTFIKNMRIFLTFFSFIKEVLNVAPSHMLPNSYDFIKDFEMVWESLEIFPKVGIFSHFMLSNLQDEVGCL